MSDTQHGDMSLSDFEAAYTWILRYCRYLEIKFVDFTWFGGEPLLYGESNLESALQKQSEIFANSDVRYVNRIQSNLTLVNDGFCKLIREYYGGFIGGSFEPFGTARKYKDGRVPIEDVERIIDALHKKHIRIGIVSTLMKNNLCPPHGLYEWFQGRVDAFRVNRAHSPDGKNLEKYLTVDEYNKYVMTLCDLYTHDDNVSFQFTNFTAIARSILLNRPLGCADILEPYWKLSIAGNGEIASYCRKNEVVLGNYYKSTPQDVITAYKQQARPYLMPEKCRGCENYEKKICSGACLGEPGRDCHESDCGYRSEYTKETISYVRQYLLSRGIKNIEDCWLDGAPRIL